MPTNVKPYKNDDTNTLGTVCENTGKTIPIICYTYALTSNVIADVFSSNNVHTGADGTAAKPTITQL